MREGGFFINIKIENNKQIEKKNYQIKRGIEEIQIKSLGI